MTTYYSSINVVPVKSVPVVRQLNAIFRSIPDKDLIVALKAPTGKPGYTVEVLWKTYIASVVLGLPSFASLIRALQNNPMLAGCLRDNQS